MNFYNLFVFEHGFLLESVVVGHALYGERFQNGPLTQQQIDTLSSSRADHVFISQLMDSKGITSFMSTPRRDLVDLATTLRKKHVPYNDPLLKSLQATEFQEIVDKKWPLEYAKERSGKPRIVRQ